MQSRKIRTFRAAFALGDLEFCDALFEVLRHVRERCGVFRFVREVRRDAVQLGLSGKSVEELNFARNV